VARDRKRAKQRRQRQGRSPEAAGGAARVNLDGPDAADKHDHPLGGHEEAEHDPAAPAPISHASAESDIAAAALAGAPPSEDHLDDGDRGQAVAPAIQPEGSRVGTFLRGCVAELRRVRWPDRRHTTQGTAVTLGFVVIAGGYLGLADAVFSRLVNAIL
jgi:preprotein translocase subunit SecE